MVGSRREEKRTMAGGLCHLLEAAKNECKDKK